MADTPTPTSTLTDTPISFPDVPSDGLELGNLASSFAQAMLGPFEVHDVIGRGGMGIVFSGTHVGQQVPVAIKVITRHGAEKPRLREVMHNEVRAVAGLDHPGIVRVLDYGEIPLAAEVATDGALKSGSPYFVMEMMAHSTLLDLVGRVTWRQAKTILLNLLDALAHSHARDVIHRDIKPGNILLDDWGGRVIPKLADFGLAFATRQPTDVSRSIGTPQYMAPEQIETPWRKHGPWSDLYSVGCLAFEMLSGRKLFGGKSIIEIFRMHLDGVRKPLRSIIRVPDGFDAWFHRMIERSVQERYRSAADAARDLAALDDSTVPEIRPPDCTQHEFALLTPVLGNLSSAPPSSLDWPKRFPVSMRLVGAGLGLFGLRQIPLAGRRTELRTLWDAFTRARAGETRIVVIHGAHGTGKTKLAEAFTQRLAEIGAATPMRATHTPDGSPEDGTPMMIARSLRAAGATRAEAGGIVRDTLPAAPGERYAWESVLALITPALAGAGEAPPFQFGSKAQRHEVVLRQIRRASADKPVAVVFDDAHFSEDSLELITYLADESQKEDASPINALVIVTVCDEELASRPEASSLLSALDERELVQRIELGPLDEVAQVSLVQDLSLLSEDLAFGVAKRTHGNPGFAVNLINDWITNGHLEVGETGFVLGAETDLLAGAPTSSRELWRGTIARVFAGHTDDETKSLELAAALGNTVWTAEWMGVCDEVGVEPCWSAVGKLVDRRLAVMTNTGWSFAHPLAIESLRESAERSNRWQQWKAACARTIDGVETDAPEKRQRIGEYWLAAGDYDRAIAPLHESAASRLAQGEYREADRLATGMVKALQEKDDDRELAQVYLFRSRVYMGMGRADEAQRWATKALDVGLDNDWNDVVASAVGFTALAKRWLGAADADEWLDRSLGLVDDIDNAFVLTVLGYLLTSLGRFDDANRVLDLGYEMCQRSEDVRALASIAYQRCRTAVYMRDFERARELGSEARERCEEIGNVPALTAVLAVLAEASRLENRLEEAYELYRESIELAQSVGHETVVSMASLGIVLLAQGRIKEAEEYFLDAANESVRAGRRRTEIVCRAGLLVCAVEQRHWTTAARVLPMIQEFTQTTDETEIDLAELLDRAGDGFCAGGRNDDAARAWAMARKQWETLDAEDRAARVAAKIAEVERL